VRNRGRHLLIFQVRPILRKWLVPSVVTLAVIAAGFWLIHAGHDSVAAAIFSVAAGFAVVVYQIGSQARNALKQSRENEAVKLKLEVYKDIVGISREASAAASDLLSSIRLFHSSLLFARQTQADMNAYVVPTSSGDPQRFIDSRLQMNSNAIKVIAVTETWQIIDPRIDIFGKAIGAALFDIDTAYNPYFDAALHVMPFGVPKDAPEEGTPTVLWNPPSGEVVQQIETLASSVIDTLMTLQSYIFDFQREMQNLLLAGLFHQTIPPRVPIDAKAVVIRLDRHDELSRYFDEQTNWGREQAQIQKALSP
jgi:hypothetical protein